MFRNLSEPEIMALVVRGRACVRMIEAAEVLVKFATSPHERVTFGEAGELARQQLRNLVRDLAPAVAAQILVASEAALGTVGDVGLN